MSSRVLRSPIKKTGVLNDRNRKRHNQKLYESMNRGPYRFAIVGLGPRGHFALESLLNSLCLAGITDGIEIIGFEETKTLGHGPVYAAGQAETNWLNITERVLDLPAREARPIGNTEIPGFAGYLEWAELNFDHWPQNRKDTFPPRSKLGRYLDARFSSMKSVLIDTGMFELVNDTVIDVSEAGEGWKVHTKSGSAYLVDDILLTVGHQPTADDDQIDAWRRHEAVSPDAVLFDEPYPVEPILEAVKRTPAARLAIRGYGLATIDVVRAIAEEFGTFEVVDTDLGTLRYITDSGADVVIAPFSLDGLAMGPKPLNPSIDAQFAPSAETFNSLSAALRDQTAQMNAQGGEFLTDMMCELAACQFVRLKRRYDGGQTDQSRLEELAAGWMKNQRQEHPSFRSANISPEAELDKLIGMATGRDPISFDYCIGQVWRHCQPTIYAALSHSALSDDVLADIIFIDESIKRYSYGPPVESLQQLLALHDAGVLNLNFVNNPDVGTDNACWTLRNTHEQFDAQIMVDAVLDSPKIEAVNSKLLTSLLSDGIIDPVHDRLGISTGEDAYVQTRSGKDVPIALLGRLAKGTVIGVDAILECFGQRPTDWADAAVNRAKPHLTTSAS